MEKIEEVWAYVSEDHNEDMEDIIGREFNMFGKEVFMPFVCADQEIIKQLRPFAEEIANLSNKKIKLIKFSVRTEVETIGYKKK